MSSFSKIFELETRTTSVQKTAEHYPNELRVIRHSQTQTSFLFFSGQMGNQDRKSKQKQCGFPDSRASLWCQMSCRPPPVTHQSWWLYHLSILVCLPPPKHSSVYSGNDSPKEWAGSGKVRVICLSKEGLLGGWRAMWANVCTLETSCLFGRVWTWRNRDLRSQESSKLYCQSASFSFTVREQKWKVVELTMADLHLTWGGEIQKSTTGHMWSPYVEGRTQGLCQSSSGYWRCRMEEDLSYNAHP